MGPVGGGEVQGVVVGAGLWRLDAGGIGSLDVSTAIVQHLRLPGVQYLRLPGLALDVLVEARESVLQPAMVDVGRRGGSVGRASNSRSKYPNDRRFEHPPASGAHEKFVRVFSETKTLC